MNLDFHKKQLIVLDLTFKFRTKMLIPFLLRIGYCSYSLFQIGLLWVQAGSACFESRPVQFLLPESDSNLFLFFLVVVCDESSSDLMLLRNGFGFVVVFESEKWFVVVDECYWICINFEIVWWWLHDCWKILCMNVLDCSCGNWEKRVLILFLRLPILICVCVEFSAFLNNWIW